MRCDQQHITKISKNALFTLENLFNVISFINGLICEGGSKHSTSHAQAAAFITMVIDMPVAHYHVCYFDDQG